MKTLIGIGMLTWCAGERRADTYSRVWLMPEGTGNFEHMISNRVDDDVAKTLVGKTGKLIANVIKTRESHHIGDMFHGIFPETPEVGEEVVLGEGVFEANNTYNIFTVGVRGEPIDPDEEWVMDPRKLYRVHDQTVELYFVED